MIKISIITQIISNYKMILSLNLSNKYKNWLKLREILIFQVVRLILMKTRRRGQSYKNTMISKNSKEE